MLTTGRSTAILLDTSLLIAFVVERDVRHQQAEKFIRSYRPSQLIIPAPVLVELFYMIAVRVHYKRAVQVFASIQVGFRIEALNDLDMVRMQAIMRQYADAEFDYADTAIMALAERLNITRIGTFDRRDFSAFRPAHCDYLELLP